MRGDLVERFDLLGAHHVSIHAPRMRGDVGGGSYALDTGKFQSTPLA